MTCAAELGEAAGQCSGDCLCLAKAVGGFAGCMMAGEEERAQ